MFRTTQSISRIFRTNRKPKTTHARRRRRVLTIESLDSRQLMDAAGLDTVVAPMDPGGIVHVAEDLQVEGIMHVSQHDSDVLRGGAGDDGLPGDGPHDNEPQRGERIEEEYRELARLRAPGIISEPTAFEVSPDLRDKINRHNELHEKMKQEREVVRQSNAELGVLREQLGLEREAYNALLDESDLEDQQVNEAREDIEKKRRLVSLMKQQRNAARATVRAAEGNLTSWENSVVTTEQTWKESRTDDSRIVYEEAARHRDEAENEFVRARIDLKHATKALSRAWSELSKAEENLSRVIDMRDANLPDKIRSQRSTVSSLASRVGQTESARLAAANEVEIAHEVLMRLNQCIVDQIATEKIAQEMRDLQKEIDDATDEAKRVALEAQQKRLEITQAFREFLTNLNALDQDTGKNVMDAIKNFADPTSIRDGLTAMAGRDDRDFSVAMADRLVAEHGAGTISRFKEINDNDLLFIFESDGTRTVVWYSNDTLRVVNMDVE